MKVEIITDTEIEEYVAIHCHDLTDEVKKLESHIKNFSSSITATDEGEIHNVSLDTEHYRALLRAWVSGEGEIGSLELLDDSGIIIAETNKELSFRENITIVNKKRYGNIYLLFLKKGSD